MAEPEEERHLKLSGEFDCAPEPLPIVRHSTSHVMAQAVKRLFPDVKLAIGPAIEDGFYYDFLKPAPFTPEDLERLESAMREIIKADYPFVREEMPREAAIKFFEERDEPFKVEILRGIDAPAVSLYRQGGTSAGGRMSGRQVRSRRSSSSRRPAPTGAATRRTPCSSGSTAPPGSAGRTSTSISGGWRRR